MRGNARAVVVLLAVIACTLAACQAVSVRAVTGEGPEQEIAPAALNRENVTRMEEQENWVVSLGPVLAMAYSPTDNRLATQGADLIVRVWDTQTGRMMGELFEHQRPGWGLAYSPDGRYLLSAGGAVGQDTILWDVERGEAISTTSTDGLFVYDVAWAPDGSQYLVVSSGSSRLYVYETSTGIRTQHRPSGISLSALAHGEHYLATTNSIGTTYVYNFAGSQVYEQIRMMRYDVNVDRLVEDDVAGRDLEFSPDESLLANCYIDGMVEIWRTSDWERVSKFEAHQYVNREKLGCADGVFSAGGDVYFTGGDDGALRAWDPLTGELLVEWQFPMEVRRVAVSPEGDRLAVGLANGVVYFYALPE